MTDIGTVELAARVRRHIVDMTNRGGSSHVASGLSIADILAVLYGAVMNFDVDRPDWPGRDRFILSKGHAGAAVYAVLAEVGFFPTSRLQNHYQNGSSLSGHVLHKGNPGVELSTGSLGHGLGVAAGRAYQGRQSRRAHRVYALLSDGECDEGSNWEAILFAAHHRLSNLVAVVDYNKLQSLASVSDTMELEPFADKWKAFGWTCVQIDGHDHDELETALDVDPTAGDKPTVVIAHTVKGKGVSFMESSVLWHYRTPQGEEYDAAVSELEGRRS